MVPRSSPSHPVGYEAVNHGGTWKMRIVTLFLIFIMISSGIALGSLGLKLTKSCDVYDASFEENVTYIYYIENTGTESLSSLKLVDDRFGTIPLIQTTLAPNANLSVLFEHKINETDMLILPSPLRNYANVTALGPFGESVISNTAVFQLSIGYNGRLYVEKRLLTLPPIRVGTKVMYRIRVTNPNTVPIHDVRIAQDILYSPYPVINTSITLDKSYLNTSEKATGFYSYVVKEDDIIGPPGSHAPAGFFDISNTVYAEGYPPWEHVGGIKVSAFSQRSIGCEYTSAHVVKKFACPSEGGLNTEITFKIFVNNTGDTLLNRTELWDLLPIGLDYVSSNPAAISTQNVNGTTTLYWTNLNQTFGILPAGGRYEIEVKAKISGSNLGILTNKVTSRVYNLRNECQTSTSGTPIFARKQNISVVKTSDISSGGPETLVNFSLIVKNTGDITLKNVFVCDLLPMGMNYVYSWPASSNNQQNVNWLDIGPMVPNASKQLWIEAVINPISENKTLTNWVNVEGKPEYGSNVTANDTACVEAFRPNISVTKTSDLTIGSAGAVINFTLNVTNIGRGLFLQAFVSDLLPTGMSYVSSSPGSNNTGQYVNWSDIGPLAVGAKKSLWIRARIDGNVYGTLINMVNVEGKPEHGQNVTNCSTANVQAQEVNIQVTKSADPAFGSSGLLINFTLNVTNSGAVMLQNVSVSDKLPSGLTYDTSSTGGLNIGQYVNWSDIGPLAVGAKKSLWIRARIDGSVYGTLINMVNVEGKPPSGEPVKNSTTKDVAALNLVSITGRKFNDLDGDGTHDGDPDPGLPGWRMELLNESGQVVAIAFTNESGFYRIDKISAGNYTLREVSQAGWKQSAPAQGYYSLVMNNSDVDEMDFGNQKILILGDYVWKDLDNDGVQDPDEPGISGVTVNLYRYIGAFDKIGGNSDSAPGSGSSFTYVGNVVTDSNGEYNFTGFGADIYRLEFELPAGYCFSPLDRGRDEEKDNDASIDGTTKVIYLADGQTDLSWDAGIQPPSEINVTKIAYPTSASPGAEIAFDIQIFNKGDTVLSQVTAKDTLPTGMTYLSDDRSGSVSGSIIYWDNLGDLVPDASIPIHLVGRIDRGVSGILTNVVNVTAKDPEDKELTDSAIARVRSLLPDITVEKTLEPVQYGQYCESKMIRGKGIIDSRTAIVDKTIALDYHDNLAGEGELELESDQAMSEAAGKLQRDVPSIDSRNKSRLNLFEQTKLEFNGSKPLTGEKSIQSMAFYGGSGAKVQEMFGAEKIEKSQTVFFGSTDKVTSPHTLGMDLSSSFKGAMETDSEIHKMFSKDIKSRQLFTGMFDLKKTIKFHENATKAEPKIGCHGIDC
jgi:uncharacterized repeat protein (TIGR01451 family)